MMRLSSRAAFFSTFVLVGCMGDDTSTPADTGSPSATDGSIDYSSFPHAPCGAQVGRFYAEIDNRPYRPSPRVFPLEMVHDGDAVLLRGGDFESPDVTTESIAYNDDPLYVYSGSYSAHLVDRAFYASASAAEYGYPDWHLQQVRFWMYSVSDTPIEYEVIAWGEQLQRVHANADGLGYSDGTKFVAEKFITVEPHVWVEVSLALDSSACVMDSLSINPPADGPSEFYVDDIQLQGSAAPL